MNFNNSNNSAHKSRISTSACRFLIAITSLTITILTSCISEPPQEPTYPTFTAKDATDKLAFLTARSTKPAPANPELQANWANFQIYVRKASYLQRTYEISDFLLTKLSLEIFKAETVLTAINANEPTYLTTGEEEEGYYCDNDGSFQPFLRYLPKAIIKKKHKLPMIVMLHGYSPSLNIINWAYFPKDLIEFAEKEGFCLVAPFARGNTDFQGIGEQDVMNVIAEMEKRYNIDPDRIILAGHSMGGMGVWTIGAHYPDRFAGLMILSARGDYYFWQDIERDALPQYKRTLIDTDFASHLLPNLKHIPILCMHGALDMVVSVKEMRHMVKTVKKANQNLLYIEDPEGYHSAGSSAFEREDVRQWTRKRRRSLPTSFEYKTYHPKYNRYQWISMTEFNHSLLPATVSVRTVDNKIEISAVGIKSINIHRDRMPESLKNIPIVAIDKLEITYPELTGNNKKQHIVVGPVKEAFLSPFISIFPKNTSDKSAQLLLRRFVFDWYNFSKTYPRVAYEAGMTPDKLAKYNVFTFGNPQTNPLVKKIIRTSPIKITKDHFIVGEWKFPREGNGLYMTYKSPWNPSRLAVVQCGLPWGLGISENHKFDFIPDYIIYSAKKDYDGSNTALCAGFFDENWCIVSELMYVATKKKQSN